jgi:hypothetical protein
VIRFMAELERTGFIAVKRGPDQPLSALPSTCGHAPCVVALFSKQPTCEPNSPPPAPSNRAI